MTALKSKPIVASASLAPDSEYSHPQAAAKGRSHRDDDHAADTGPGLCHQLSNLFPMTLRVRLFRCVQRRRGGRAREARVFDEAMAGGCTADYDVPPVHSGVYAENGCDSAPPPPPLPPHSFLCFGADCCCCCSSHPSALDRSDDGVGDDGSRCAGSWRAWNSTSYGYRLECAPSFQLCMWVTPRQWARLHANGLMLACFMLALATLFVFIPVHERQQEQRRTTLDSPTASAAFAAGGSAVPTPHPSGGGFGQVVDEAAVRGIVAAGGVVDAARDGVAGVIAGGGGGGDASAGLGDGASADDEAEDAKSGSAILFYSLWVAIVKGPRQSRQQSLRLRQKHLWSRTVVAWAYLLSALSFVMVDLMEAWWLWTQVRPRAGTFVDDGASSASSPSPNSPPASGAGGGGAAAAAAVGERDSLLPVEGSGSGGGGGYGGVGRYYPFGDRTPRNGYGGTVPFAGPDDDGDAEREGDSVGDDEGRAVRADGGELGVAPAINSERGRTGGRRRTSTAKSDAAKVTAAVMRYGDDEEDYGMDEALPNEPVYGLSAYPRKGDRRLVKALRVTCICSLITALADSFCFAIYTPQVQQLLAIVPFGLGKVVAEFLFFWGDRFLLVGFLCTLIGLGGRVYRRLCLENHRTARVVRYPPFSFF